MTDTDKFRAFVEQMARMVVPGDDDEDMQARVLRARDEVGYGNYDPPEDDFVAEDAVLAAADDGFLSSETSAFWDMVRAARELLR